jgi:hypothetical protein
MVAQPSGGNERNRGNIGSALTEELVPCTPLAHPPQINKQGYELVASERAGAHTGTPTAKDEQLRVINAIPSYWGPRNLS